LEKEQRKASDVLLELESKVDVLISFVRTQDLNIKILSNKINSLIEKSNNIQAPSTPSFKIEQFDAPSNELKIEISPDDSILLETSPKGFRRTSRPETYSNVPIVKNTNIQKLVEPEIIVKSLPISIPKENVQNVKRQNLAAQNTVPVVQRVVDKNGKSVFLADVEIIEMSTKTSLFKTRTNGAGKWAYSLAIGQYRILIKKKESIDKEKLEVMQDIDVSGDISPLTLETVIIK
jgi:hypothetical protein